MSKPRWPANRLFLGIFRNACEAILKLNLKFLNLKIYDLNSNGIKRYIRSVSDEAWYQDNIDFMNRVENSSSTSPPPYSYAIVPIDITKPVPEKTFHQLEAILLIMFPSDFRLVCIAELILDSSLKYMASRASTFDSPSYSYLKDRDNPFCLILNFDTTRSCLTNINRFLKANFHPNNQSKYLSLSIESYVNGFKHNDITMSYINYCIALEALTDSRTEVTHRICRTCAIINSDDKTSGRTIYFNTSQFYDLRSAIVHGNRFHNLQEYFFNLQALVSRTLVELLLLSVY